MTLFQAGPYQKGQRGVWHPQSSDTVGKTVSVVKKSVSVGKKVYVRRQDDDGSVA